MRRIILLIVLVIILFALWLGLGSASSTKFPFGLQKNLQKVPDSAVKVVTEESVVVDTVKKVGQSVVTVAQDIPESHSSHSLNELVVCQIAEKVRSL